MTIFGDVTPLPAEQQVCTKITNMISFPEYHAMSPDSVNFVFDIYTYEAISGHVCHIAIISFICELCTAES